MSYPKIVFADPQAGPPKPSNKHVSVNPEGDEFVDLEFVEEPLGVMAEQGHGYIRVEFGETIGPGNRYKIIRKLGWGMNSSVWMAFDLTEKRYVAIKALKGYSTILATKGMTVELEAMERVASIPPPPGIPPNHCPRLLASFVHTGKDQDGDHQCLVTDLMGGDIKSLGVEVALKKGFPLPLVKRILRHTLRGLAHMHHCNIVHTDLKDDNIMFDTGPLTNDDIEMLLKKEPSRRHPPEESWDCVVQAAVSQPLPLPSLCEAMTRNYMVADFGSAQPGFLHTTNEITPRTLRAPEIILRGSWDTNIDIWAFGCLIFELITGENLFFYKHWPECNLDEPTGHLWQMLCFTRERMTRQQVTSSDLGAQYFDLDNNVDSPFCDLKAHPPILDNPFILSLRKLLDETDVLATVAIMKKCLRLNPQDRATAEELLQDPWWHGTD